MGIIAESWCRNDPYGQLQYNFSLSSYHSHPLYYVSTIFSPSHGMPAHFTPSLLHHPQITSHPLMSTIRPPPSRPHVSCFACGCLFITRARLICHQLTCFSHKQSSTVRVVMLPTLPNSPPYYTWTWVTFVDVIDVFHLGLLHPHSYHHIPYVLHWCSTCLAYSFNPYDHWPIWHCNLAYNFFFSFLGVCFFLPEVARKVNKRLVPTSINT